MGKGKTLCFGDEGTVENSGVGWTALKSHLGRVYRQVSGGGTKIMTRLKIMVTSLVSTSPLRLNRSKRGFRGLRTLDGPGRTYVSLGCFYRT